MADIAPVLDFESEADKIIDKYFAERGVTKDLLEIDEKKLIIKELALSNRKSEIIPKLNEHRRVSGLPLLERSFDIFYYAREYALLIEDISLHYAVNLAKKFRFANRITRIAKLNDVAETVLERINTRNEKEALGGKEESIHNDNIKLFSQLLNSIDEQMGKLHVTKLDVSVRDAAATPVLSNPAEIKSIIADTLKKYSNQLPASVDANFSSITDYSKCEFAEEFTNITFCQYHGEQCHVQKDEIKICPLFLNKILMQNRAWMAKRYVNDNLSVRQIADIAGCKEPDDKVLTRVRNKLKNYGIYRDTANTDK